MPQREPSLMGRFLRSAPDDSLRGKAATWASLSTRSTALRCSLAAIAAWLLTLAPVLLGRGQPLGARFASLAALGLCVAGTQLIRRSPRAARAIGISGYLGAATLAWWLAAGTRSMAGFDPLRGFFGLLAWAIYAASWSEPWSVADHRLDEAPPGEASGLKPRRGPPRGALLVGASGVAAGLGCLALAWSVEEASRAVWARTIGVVAAVALTSGSSAIASALAREDRASGHPRWPVDRQVIGALFAFALLAGAAVSLTRLR